jgi:hypothetical protein
LAIVEGYIEGHPQDHARGEPETATTAKNAHVRPPMSAENGSRLRQLLETSRYEKTEDGLPDASASAVRQ